LKEAWANLEGLSPFKFLNRSEDRTYQILTEIASERGLSVFPKVRLIDAFDRETASLDPLQETFAIRAHVDFLLVNADRVPVMAIEFDGPSHLSDKQQRRDETKNQICEQAGLPLIRATSSYLTHHYGGMTALRWLVETTELAIAFEAAQEAGAIPWEEGFDATLIHDPKTSTFPYWVSANAQMKLNALRRQGVIKRMAHRMTSCVDGPEALNVAIAELPDGRWIAQTGRMRDQALPFYYRELLDMVTTCELARKVEAFMAGDQSTPLHPEVVARRLKPRFERYRPGSGSSCGGLGNELDQALGMGTNNYTWGLQW